MKLGLNKLLPLTILLVLCFFCTTSHIIAQDNDDDSFEVYLSFAHRGIINSVVVSYYKNDAFYLPVNELFNLFQLEANTNGLVVSGYFSIDQIPYSINLDAQTIRYGEDTYNITREDFIIKELDFYLHPRLYEEIFGLDFNVDFNSLTLNLVTIKELPFIERVLRERSRRLNESYIAAPSFFPLLNGRERKLLDGGFLDYSFSSNISEDEQLFLYNNSVGLHLLGGDLQGNIFGTLSADQRTFTTNNLKWDYVFNNEKVLSRLTIGQTMMDGALSNPYTGIRLTNEPIEARRLFDEYLIEGFTVPESEVEVYLNNSLVAFQRTDELGNYRFITPLYYGSSQLDVRIFGPTGQISQQSRRIQVPFSFIPKGEINYKINAGYLDNPIIGSTERNLALQANTAIGVSRWLTARFGAEYYSDALEDDIPSFTANLSARAFSNYILTAETVTSSYYRFIVNAIYPSSANLNIDYTEYSSNQNIFNSSGYDRQIVANTSIPLRIGKTPLNVRVSNFTRFRESIYFSTQRVNLSSRIKNLSARVGYLNRTINTYNFFEPSSNTRLESSFTYNFSRRQSVPKILRGSFFRGQLTYLYSDKKIESGEILISRAFLRTGRFQLSFGRNFNTGFNSMRFNLVFDFDRFRSNTTTSSVRNSFNTVQNIRGSIGYDSNYNNLLFTNRNQVGRAATAIKLFVDNNANQKFDEGDDPIPEGTLRIGRGGTAIIQKNDVTYYSLMQSYFQYNLEMNKGSIRNPMLVPEIQEFSIITDPNRFKRIEIPFYMSGVMEGLVERSISEDNSVGIGGLKLNLKALDKDFTKEVRTFADGSFYEYELPPGDYELSVDQSQLSILNVIPSPEVVKFTVNAIPEGDFVEGLQIKLLPNVEELDSVQIEEQLTIAQVTEEIKTAPEVLEYSQEIFETIDDALRLIVRAQNAFYSKDLNKAIFLVDESLELFETAQGHALKGSFYYFEGNIEQAQRHWEQALRFNPDLYIPDMDTLEERVNTSASD